MSRDSASFGCRRAVPVAATGRCWAAPRPEERGWPVAAERVGDSPASRSACPGQRPGGRRTPASAAPRLHPRLPSPGPAGWASPPRAALQRTRLRGRGARLPQRCRKPAARPGTGSSSSDHLGSQVRLAPLYEFAIWDLKHLRAGRAEDIGRAAQPRAAPRGLLGLPATSTAGHGSGRAPRPGTPRRRARP